MCLERLRQSGLSQSAVHRSKFPSHRRIVIVVIVNALLVLVFAHRSTCTLCEFFAARHHEHSKEHDKHWALLVSRDSTRNPCSNIYTQTFIPPHGRFCSGLRLVHDEWNSVLTARDAHLIVQRLTVTWRAMFSRPASEHALCSGVADPPYATFHAPPRHEVPVLRQAELRFFASMCGDSLTASP